MKREPRPFGEGILEVAETIDDMTFGFGEIDIAPPGDPEIRRQVIDEIRKDEPIGVANKVLLGQMNREIQDEGRDDADAE